jgi:hypothetical protein
MYLSSSEMASLVLGFESWDAFSSCSRSFSAFSFSARAWKECSYVLCDRIFKMIKKTSKVPRDGYYQIY